MLQRSISDRSVFSHEFRGFESTETIDMPIWMRETYLSDQLCADLGLHPRPLAQFFEQPSRQVAVGLGRR